MSLLDTHSYSNVHGFVISSKVGSTQNGKRRGYSALDLFPIGAAGFE
jgi:hypothetical protein